MIPVSIALTTYNRGNVLKETIDSILLQTFYDFELIISDDNSTDDTEKICREYEKQDKRVKYFKNETNFNMPGNLNSAISRANGKYIANLHDGDIYRNDLIAKWKAALDRYPNASFVFNEYLSIHNNGSTTISKANINGEVGKLEIILDFFKTVTSNVWGTCMVRAEAYQKYGLFNSEYGFISDVEMWLRLARYTDYAYVHEPLITITPREKNHFLSHHHWLQLYWSFSIYKSMLALYKDILTDEVKLFTKNYKNLLLKKNFYYMLLSIKHKKWKQVKEGFAIWRDSNDLLFKYSGKILGNKNNLPDWYKKDYWKSLYI